MFAQLQSLSHFSFLQGASSPEELVSEAHSLGYQAIAITDECSLAGIVKAHAMAEQLNMQLIIGSHFCVQSAHQSSTTSPDNPSVCHLVLLASSRQAYSEISLLISKARRRSKKGEYQVNFMDLQFGTRHCLAVWVPDMTNTRQHSEWQEQLGCLKRYFKQRLWLGVNLQRNGMDDQHYQLCHSLAQQYDVSMVACPTVLMHQRQCQPLHDTITAIRHNCSIVELGQRRMSNSEAYLRPLENLENLYPAELLQETLQLAELCCFSLRELQHDYPEELVPKALSATEHLRNLTYQGAQKRWPTGIPAQLKQQLEFELRIIAELNYEHYFLTVEDIVSFARAQNILCQGRGSAANSVVCYCLHITAVNPQHSSLLFERFISKERNEPPDIDVDFEHERREEVIQYIYQKYTRKRAALVATVITYRPRSAVRDVGKALGFDTHLIDRLAKDLAWWDKPEQLGVRLTSSGIAAGSHMAELFLMLLRQIIGRPRHLSQHVGGFLITQTPISNLVPIENAAMPERTIIQWDKDDIETLGLLKIDVLALGMLSAIRKSFDLIRQHYAIDMSLNSIPADDPATYDRLCRGDSVGVFQVESRAQMSMLPRLRPRCYYDLVIQVAIVRPGPIQGDMVHPYLRRRNGEEPVHYQSPEIKSVLQRTLGVPIFQEQVIKLAMVAAGFSGGEADQLRRAMASWGRNGNLSGFKQRLTEGMLARGHSLEFAERLFRQMQGFGEYGFPESHAASFALLVYASAWLKTHYPAAFYCGLLNSLPMGFYSASQLIQDAQRHNIVCLPIDVNNSLWDHQLQHPSYSRIHPHAHQTISQQANGQQLCLRLGLRLIKGFSRTSAERLIHARKTAPDLFSSLVTLKRQAQLNSRDMQLLAAANALGPLTRHRRDAHWQVQAIEDCGSLLPESTDSETLESETAFIAEPSAMETTLADYRHTGLTLNHHPMALLRQMPPFDRCLTAQQLRDIRSGRFVRIAGVVTGRQKPGTASGVIFMTLEDETGNTNVVIWKPLQQRRRKELLQSRILVIKGVLERKDSVIHVIAGDLEDHSHQLSGFIENSRDFH